MMEAKPAILALSFEMMMKKIDIWSLLQKAINLEINQREKQIKDI